MHETRLIEWLKSMNGLTAALVTSVATPSAIWAAFTSQLAPVAEFFGWPSWTVQVGALMLLAPILLFVVRSYRRFAKASRLEQPDRFSLAATTPESLIGRTDDLAKLLDSVARNRLVLLDGESGCGKSALVGAGLVPRLQVGAGLLPVLVRDWGDDWVRGPLATALGALFEVLTPEQRSTLGWTQAPDLAADTTALTTELGIRFTNVFTQLGRRPLLITDQFDDYQARNLARFLDEDGNWLKPDALAVSNPFWGLAGSQLRGGALHMLAVTRADTASGLSCLRFVDTTMTADRHLPRVDLEYLRPLLNCIAPDDATPPVVSQPDQGWNELRERLHADLRLQGAILMQQVRTVLLGLRQLPVLTVRAYRSAGELRGVESLVIARAIRRAGDAAGGGEAAQIAARGLLGALVQPGGPSQPPKAQRVSFDTLAEKASDRGTAMEMLLALQADDVVRPAEGVAGESAWQLDHDYLARAVLAEARQADQWSIALHEGLEQFRQGAGDWRRSWRALLPVTEQVRMAWERARGRLRYGEAASYAVFSLIKPGLVLLLVCSVSVGAYLWNEDRLLSAQARRLYDRFVGANETSAVLDAWRAPKAERDRLFRLVSEDESRLAGATRTAWPLAHGGLEPERLKESAYLLRMRLAHETDSDISQNVAQVYAAVAAKLTNQTTVKLETEALLELLAHETNRVIVRSLAQAYVAIVAKLTDQTALTQEAEALHERLTRETHNFITESLTLAYAAVAVKLTDQTAIQRVGKVLHDRLARETDTNLTLVLAQAYATVAAKLTDQTAIQRAAEALNELLARDTSTLNMPSLAQAYAAVATKLTDQASIKKEAEALRERLERETENANGSRCAQAYASVVATLTNQASIKQESEALHLLLTQGSNHELASNRAKAYAAVVTQLADQTAIQQAARLLLELLERETTPSIASSLAQDYAAVAAQLTDQVAIKQATEALHNRFAHETNRVIALNLAPAYAAVAVKLTDQAAIVHATEVLSARLGRWINIFNDQGFIQAYSAVAAKLTDQTAIKREAQALRERLLSGTDGSAHVELALGYATVAAQLTDQAAVKHESEALRELLSLETNNTIASFLAEAYAAVTAQVIDQAAIQQAIEALRERLTHESNSFDASRLAKAYATLAQRKLEFDLRQQHKIAAALHVQEILILVGHPFLNDGVSLLGTLEPMAKRSFGSDTGAAVEWWIKEFNGDPTTLRLPPPERR